MEIKWIWIKEFLECRTKFAMDLQKKNSMGQHSTFGSTFVILIFEISNIKITKFELFDFFIFEFILYFYVCLNGTVTIQI